MQTASITTPFPLWPHQVAAIERFGLKHHAFLNHEMGLGKTVTTLCLLFLIREYLGRWPRTVLLAPVSTLFNWLREAQTLYPELAAQMMVAFGSTKKKAQTFDDGFAEGKRVFVTNHEALIALPVIQRIKALSPEVLVVDESQRVKSRKSKRTKALFPIADKAEWKILLSGTPVTNEAEDLWSQLRILGGAKYVDLNFYVFLRHYFYDRNAAWASSPNHFSDYVLNPQKADDLRALLAGVVDTVKKADVMDLPPIVRAPRYVPLSSSIEKIYRDVERDYLAVLGDSIISTDMALTRLLRLLQICSGVVKTDEGEERFYETEKMTALQEILRDLAPKEKVIVWTPWVATYKPIVELCQRLGLKGIYCSEKPGPKRQALIDQFNDDAAVRVLLANPASMGVGVNLQGASAMIYFAKTYNLEHDQQSEARAHRGNSTHERILRIDLVTQGTEEERVEEALMKKLSLQNFIFSRRSGEPVPEADLRAVRDALDVFWGQT